MLTDKQTEAFFSIVPKKQMFFSWGNLADFVKRLDEISGNKFEMAFIQSEYHSGFEVAEILFENQRYTLELVSQEDLDIAEVLSQINQWLQTNQYLPRNFCFDIVQFENQAIGVCFFDTFAKAQLIKAGLTDIFHFWLK